MTDQVLPNDVLREISKYWNGHALAYTCAALYASWNPEDYIVESHTCDGGVRYITNQMPNGTYHGDRVVKQRDIVTTSRYDRGVMMTTTRDGPAYRSVDIRVEGRWCRWMSGLYAEKPAKLHADAVGLVYLISLTVMSLPVAVRKDVKFGDFPAVAREILAVSRLG